VEGDRNATIRGVFPDPPPLLLVEPLGPEPGYHQVRDDVAEAVGGGEIYGVADVPVVDHVVAEALSREIQKDQPQRYEAGRT